MGRQYIMWKCVTTCMCLSAEAPYNVQSLAYLLQAAIENDFQPASFLNGTMQDLQT